MVIGYRLSVSVIYPKMWLWPTIDQIKSVALNGPFRIGETFSFARRTFLRHHCLFGDRLCSTQSRDSLWLNYEWELATLSLHSMQCICTCYIVVYIPWSADCTRCQGILDTDLRPDYVPRSGLDSRLVITSNDYSTFLHSLLWGHVGGRTRVHIFRFDRCIYSLCIWHQLLANGLAIITS